MLEPLPETQEAIDEYLEWSEPDVGQVLADLATQVLDVVPDTVALSLTLIRDELTFTLAARNLATAAVDAMQYLDQGPCEAALETGDVVAISVDDLLDEQHWMLFAQAAAAVGIRSTLSLPLRQQGRVIGGINLYASTSQAFAGRHDAVAALVGARAEEAVRNADLSFSSRRRAVDAPRRLRELNQIDTALGILMARFDETEDRARQRLTRAAAQGGMTAASLARALVDLYDNQDSEGWAG